MKSVFAVLALLCLATIGWCADAVFASSDGQWMDSTVEAKGRDFHQVLWTFEAYKLKENKPFSMLVRVTPTPGGKIKKDDVKWKVPYVAGARHPAIPWIGGGYKPEEIAEITRRANTAYATWVARK